MSWQWLKDFTNWLGGVSTSQTAVGSLIVFNLVAVSFAIIANLIKSFQDYIFQRRKAWIDRNIIFLETQLSVLYGPIYGLLKANQQLVQELKGPSSSLKDRQPEIIRNAVIPNNLKVVGIIEGNFHLLESQQMPNSFLQFVVHAEFQRATGSASGIVPSGLFPFPDEFATEIYSTTERLLASLKEKRERLR